MVVLTGLDAFLGRSWSPLPPTAGLGVNCHPDPPFLLFTFVSAGTCVCIWLFSSGHRTLLALKRPLGDISARGEGESLYWGS